MTAAPQLVLVFTIRLADEGAARPADQRVDGEAEQLGGAGARTEDDAVDVEDERVPDS